MPANALYFHRVGLLACLSLAFYSSLAISGCARNSDLGKDTLVIIESGDTITLNPLYISDALSAQVALAIFDPLAQMSPNFHLVPWLATSWHESSDHLHWTIYLRKGVTWSDGAPFSANDVVWTWKLYLNRNSGYPFYGQVAFIKRVMALDSYTVRFDLKTPNALFPMYVLNAAALPKHILNKYSVGEQRQSRFGDHPIGTGPYMLSKWQRDDKMELVRNPHWWHGIAKIPKILIRVVFIDQAGIEAIREGEAQMLDGTGLQGMSQLRGDSNIRFIRLTNLFVGNVLTNHKRQGLDDNTVLQAMMYGWDRAQLVNGLHHGNALISSGIEPPGLTAWYNPHVKQYPYDPMRARALLERAGWHLGPDGIRTRNGKRLYYGYIMAGRDGAAQDDAAEFQADMRDIGIGVSVQALDWSTLLQKENDGDYDLAQGGWGGTPDPDEFTFLDSSQFPPIGNNVMFYTDPIVDRDLRAGLTHVNLSQRKVYYDNFQRRLAEHLPFLFSTVGYTHLAVSTRLHVDPKAMLPSPYLFYNIADWSFRQ